MDGLPTLSKREQYLPESAACLAVMMLGEVLGKGSWRGECGGGVVSSE